MLPYRGAEAARPPSLTVVVLPGEGEVRKEVAVAQAAFDRARALERLGTEAFDVLVIGGGATGAGVALDAATRGLRTALVERGDFATGTSSKLIHGGGERKVLPGWMPGVSKGR
jgi:NADPH-dependent 2,4-dienoyl-CoA reductase/sulfur reductase-like enzyme